MGIVLTLALCATSLAARATPASPAAPPAVDAAIAAEGTGASTAPLPLMQRVRNKASDMVVSAMDFIGVNYRYGGNNAEEGFDCSGFTRYMFEHSLGLVLPRRSADQARSPDLIKIDRQDLRPGDLVFFNTVRRAFSHVGIYVGDGKFIHAPRTGANVRVETMENSYWLKRFSGARRVSAESLTEQGLLPERAEPVALPVVMPVKVAGPLAAQDEWFIPATLRRPPAISSTRHP